MTEWKRSLGCMEYKIEAEDLLYVYAVTLKDRKSQIK